MFPALAPTAAWRDLRHPARWRPPKVREMLELVRSGVESRGQGFRVVGAVAQGGLRIDGGPGGFGERTLSLVNPAWVPAAREDTARDGGVLEEVRVDRLRSLDGIPKVSTQWSDAGPGIGRSVGMRAEPPRTTVPFGSELPPSASWRLTRRRAGTAEA